MQHRDKLWFYVHSAAVSERTGLVFLLVSIKDNKEQKKYPNYKILSNESLKKNPK